MRYREKCLNEKGESCEVCGTDENIVVHHIDGDRENNDLENLAPVCLNCHHAIHNGELEDWADKILPKEQRTREVSVKFGPDDHKNADVIREASSASNDQQAIRLAVDQHSNRIQSIGERRGLLEDLRSEFGFTGEDEIVNIALQHLLDSVENMKAAAGEHSANDINDLCGTSVLKFHYRGTSASPWRSSGELSAQDVLPDEQ